MKWRGDEADMVVVACPMNVGGVMLSKLASFPAPPQLLSHTVQYATKAGEEPGNRATQSSAGHYVLYKYQSRDKKSCILLFRHHK